MHAYIYTYIHADKYTYLHTNMHTYIHTYMHILGAVPSFLAGGVLMLEEVYTIHTYIHTYIQLAQSPQLWPAEFSCSKKPLSLHPLQNVPTQTFEQDTFETGTTFADVRKGHI